ncbi:hypothetical protein G6F31_018726 [Rhizopus arrhizus]|nr:hypothetical protein G6F31_018726 [Rhizopus arrhizus]
MASRTRRSISAAGTRRIRRPYAILRSTRRDGRVVDEDLALVGVGEARDQVQQGGLAAAAGPQQGDEFPLLDVQVEGVPRLVGAKAHRHAFDGEQSGHD